MLAVITGANRGIGLEIARSVLAAGYDVVMACRNVKLARQVRDSFAGVFPKARIEVLALDLANLASVRAFADEMLARGERIDLLMNNAGALLDHSETTVDGLEFNVSVNYVGPYLLTRSLLPLLGKGSRIVNMASLVYRYGRIDLPEFFTHGLKSRKYKRFAVYSNSKLAITLFTLSLAEKLRDRGITVNASDPGIVSTDIIRMNNKLVDTLCDIFFRPVINTPAQGAATAVDLLLNPEKAAQTGTFNKKCRPVKLSGRILDHPMKEILWEETERLISESQAVSGYSL